MADETADHNLVDLYRQLAVLFDQEAVRVERGEPTTP
jgi:hypothetical protein